MKVFTTLERQTQKNLLLLFSAGLLFWLSLTSLLPVLPAYIADVSPDNRAVQVAIAQWDFSVLLSVEAQVGLIMGCFAIGLLLSRGPLGALADRRGRKIAVLMGTAVAAIAPWGYPLATETHLLMALRTFHGISIAALTTGYSALVVDLSPVKQRGEIVGYMSLTIPVGMALGPALGSYVEASLGYIPLFIISGVLGILSFALASQVREAEAFKAILARSKVDAPAKTNLWHLLVSPRLRIPAIVMLLSGTVFGSIINFLPLYIRESEVNVTAGLFYLTAAIASFAVRLFAGRSSDRYGRGIFITVSLICYCLSMSILSSAREPFAFLLAAILEGFAGGILVPTAIALMSDRSVAGERGGVYAICIGGFDLGIAIAGSIFGFLIQPLGFGTLYSIASGLALMGLFIFTTQSSKSLKHSLRFAIGRERDVYAIEQ